MAQTILNKKQLPGVTVYTDAANSFSQPITLPGAPVADLQAATKKYVDDAVTASAAGLDVKQSVRVATVSGFSSTYNSTTGAAGKGQITEVTNSIDGVSLQVGNRVLVKNHVTASANGIYVVTTVGTGANGVWDRAADFDSNEDVTANAFMFVEEGTVNADSGWVLTTNGPITLGGVSGTNLTFTQFSGAGVGVSSISVATANGLQGTSSGGNTPVLTLSTGLSSGNVRSNGSGGFVIGQVALGSEVSGTLPLANGGTNATDAAGARTNLGLVIGTHVLAPNGSAAALTNFPTFNQNTTGNAATATALQTARTIGGVSFNGSADITVATATGGFTVSGGNLALGANSLTMTGALGATGARVSHGWFTDVTVTNTITGSISGNAATATNATNVAITNDEATATSVYPTWVTTASGNQGNRTSSSKLSFVPSTGVLSSTVFAGSGAQLTNLPAANLTGTIATGVLGASSLFVGTTSIALNRASANQALTGILSVVFPGATTGTVTLVPAAVAGTTTLTMPATTGTLITSGDSGTVTNTMLAGSISDAKLNQITSANKVTTGALTGTLFTLGSTAIAANSTITSVTGLTSVTATTFVGALTGNASTATTSTVAVSLQTGRTISGTGEATFTTGSFDGTSNVSGAVTLSNAAVIGKVLTGFTSGAGTVTGADTILGAFQKLNGNINLKQNAVNNSNYKVGVAPTGTINGTNLVFTLPDTPIAETEMIFVNGVLQRRESGNDYVIDGNTITFEAGNAPLAGSQILATYFK